MDNNSQSNETKTDTVSNGSQEDMSPADQLKKVTEDLQLQAEKFKNDYLYLKAEFDNYKRNAIKERADLMKYGSERLINEILNVVDNFERAIAVELTPNNLDTYKKGIEMTEKDLKSALLKYGVTPVESQGQAFDPLMHEALTSEESDEVPPGHVLRTFRKAYKYHDKVLRPAQVVVAKKKN